MSAIKLLQVYTPINFNLSGTVVSMNHGLIKEVVPLIPDIVDKTNCVCIIEEDKHEIAIQFIKGSTGVSDYLKVIIGQPYRVKENDNLTLIFDSTI